MRHNIFHISSTPARSTSFSEIVKLRQYLPQTCETSYIYDVQIHLAVLYPRDFVQALMPL